MRMVLFENKKPRFKNRGLCCGPISASGANQVDLSLTKQQLRYVEQSFVNAMRIQRYTKDLVIPKQPNRNYKNIRRLNRNGSKFLDTCRVVPSFSKLSRKCSKSRFQITEMNKISRLQPMNGDFNSPEILQKQAA
jgi:hypothetical protein